MKTPKLAVIAERIRQHLVRLEADLKWNTRDRRYGQMKLWLSGACASGAYVMVTYIGYQGPTTLTKARALRYLEWLDAGNKGSHYTQDAVEGRGRART